MESVISLPQAKVPANCPYPKPAQSSPFPHIPVLDDPSSSESNGEEKSLLQAVVEVRSWGRYAAVRLSCQDVLRRM